MGSARTAVRGKGSFPLRRDYTSGPIRFVGGTDKEIFHGQGWANEWDIYIYPHLSRSQGLTRRLTLPPVMPNREGSVYAEVACQSRPELGHRLDVVVNRVHTPIAMAEIPVRHDELAAIGQKTAYLGQFLRLESSNIFEDALGNDEIEHLAAEFYGGLEKVSLDQIRRGIMYGYINPVVVDVFTEQVPESRGPAANIQEIGFSPLRYAIYDSHSLLHPEMSLSELQILFAPEIPCIVSHVTDCTVRSRSFCAACPVIHIHLHL
jgi:hypothetical protein